LKDNNISSSVSEKSDSIETEYSSGGKGIYLRPNHELNDAVCALAARKDIRIQDLYNPINKLLKKVLVEQQEGVLAPLRQLASISPFKLFVTTTFDGLLARAIDRERFNGEEKTAQIEFAPNLSSDKRLDIPEFEFRPPDFSAVFYLFGRSSSQPYSYAIHDEDHLEFVYNLQVGHGNSPERFLSEIRSKNLLLIGCNLADWLGRFFLRFSNLRRLYGERGKKEFLVCATAASDPNFTIFLERFSQNTRLFPCRARNLFPNSQRNGKIISASNLSRQNKRPILQNHPPVQFSGGIFISYAHEDIAAAHSFYAGLTEIGWEEKEIWFDTSNWSPGTNGPKKSKMPSSAALFSSRLFLKIQKN